MRWQSAIVPSRGSISNREPLTESLLFSRAKDLPSIFHSTMNSPTNVRLHVGRAEMFESEQTRVLMTLAPVVNSTSGWIGKL
jgi:hypothetical protein